MKEKSSPINIIWFTMVFLSLAVASFKGTIPEVNAELFASAKSAVNIAIGLIGPMALWLGIMKVAEAAGLMKIIARKLRPIMVRLFPDIPEEHPAMSAIIMNMAANMLGLGNAATPMGIKAMIEMQKLNTQKETATNSMALFLAINTSSVTLLPLGAITVRAAAGADNPASILLPSILATTCSTTMAIFAAKFLEKRTPNPAKATTIISNDTNEADSEHTNLSETMVELLPPSIWGKGFGIGLILLFIVGAIYRFSISDQYTHMMALHFADVFTKDSMLAVTELLLPVIIIALIGFGYFKGVKIYETVTEGAKEGFNTAVRIIPFMVAIIVAIGMVKKSGLLGLIADILKPLTSLIGMPVEALSLAIMRPLSGGGSFGMMSRFVNDDPNSFLSDLVSTMQGSTETTFYVLAVYFGAVGIKKSRHAVPAALLADVTGFIAAFIAVKLFI